MSWIDGREGRDGPVAGVRAGDDLGERVGVDLERRRRRRGPTRARRAGAARRSSRASSRRPRSRWPSGPGAGTGARRARPRTAREPRRAAPRARPWRRRSRRPRARPTWWRSDARAARRRASPPGASSGAGHPVHVRRLEVGGARAVVGGVAPRGVEQARQKQRAHDGLVLAQRVRELEQRHVAEPQPLDRLGRGEAPRDDLVQAAVAQRVLDPPAQALRVA